MAMILERTMIFGFTLRNVMPTRSMSPTLAPVVLDWIHRLKYFANRTVNTSENRMITPPQTYRMIWKRVSSAGACRKSGGIGGPQGCGTSRDAPGRNRRGEHDRVI